MGNYAGPFHRRFQLRRQKKMVAIIKEPTHIFSIRVPESLYQLLRKRSEELEVPQNRLILEGLQTRLGDKDVTAPNGRTDSASNGTR